MFKENTIYYGDNEEVLKQFPEGSIDLAYADPPFFSNKLYEVIWGEKFEKRAFEDRWAGGHKGINTYLEWMEPRLRECHRVLKDTGTMYLHCDWHASHYLKTVMDSIFGYTNFLDEIVWHYESGGRAKHFYPRKHDVILFYAKNKRKDYHFNWEAIGIPRNVCESCGTVLKKWNNLARHMDNHGRVYRTIKSNGKIYKYYDDEPVPPTDVWNDISHLQQKDPERLGYPTQKPLKLLERIVLASSAPDDIVLDAFCGCGTTLSAAQKHKRKWVGIDISYTACKEMAKRLRKEYSVHAEVIGAPATLADLKRMKPFDFQNWVFNRIYGRANPKKVADEGVDGWTFNGDPVQVKQSEDVGDPIVRLLFGDMQRLNKKFGAVVAFSFSTTANERVNELKRQHGVTIKLVKVDDILKTPEIVFEKEVKEDEDE
jgi:DNA modification methylase